MYNTTFIDSNNTLLEFAAEINNVSQGWIFGLILLFIFLLLMVTMKHYNTKATMIVTSFITALIGAVMMFLGFIQFQWSYMGIIAIIGFIIIYKIKEDEGG